jgi:hypothetical protein
MRMSEQFDVRCHFGLPTLFDFESTEEMTGAKKKTGNSAFSAESENFILVIGQRDEFKTGILKSECHIY